MELFLIIRELIDLLPSVKLMVTINLIQISPALLNSSCAWASEEAQLHELYDSDFTGAVTTRTSTLNGFAEDSPAVHTVGTLLLTSVQLIDL